MTMHTMHPAILLGSYTWDQDRMPSDEYDIRMDAARALMAENGWRALFVYGDAQDYRLIGHLTNFVPRLRWAMAMLPFEGEPRLLVSMSSRDMPAMRQMTWIKDVHSGWAWQSVFDPWLESFCAAEDGDPVRVGLTGQGLMRPGFAETLRASAGNRVALEPADEVFLPLVRTKRPRALAFVRDASRVVDAAADALVAAWRGGADGMHAAIAGERAARERSAYDVRVLFSVDGGRTLLPFYGLTEGRGDPMAAYVAVNYMGYWADAFVTAGSAGSEAERRVRAALDAMLAKAAPGAAAAALAEEAARALGGLARHPVVGEVFGHGIGLSLTEDPEISAASRAALEPGGVYSLRAGIADEAAGHALASAMVHVTPRGTEILRGSA